MTPIRRVSGQPPLNSSLDIFRSAGSATCPSFCGHQRPSTVVLHAWAPRRMSPKHRFVEEPHVDTNLAEDSQLKALDNTLQASGLEHEIIQHIGRDPATDILDIANSREAAMIVLGLRRRSAVGKLLLGSTAQSILLNADCPVLTIRA
ncbi:universal stress protein [Arthrobacter nitrophenolicus]|uniref:Universal stress protein n=1 Tax=Arthrobacter nitrophenolicus TaxID=683150 RepID=A0A4R5XL80_9MICC|nr:universal stress protein [Arthrobacter nitrophenolicus]TDL32121.1 universal stress protein [Arthrobacter nitrophenolicus]